MIYGRANLRVSYAIWGPFNLSSSPGIFITHMFYLQLFCSPWIFCSVFFFPPLFVFFAFQFSTILLIYSLAQIFLFSVMSSLLISPSKALFSSVTVVLFFISSFPPPPTLVLCQNFHLSAYITHLFLHAIYFIRALSILITVVLNSCSDNFDISAMPDSDACSVSSNCAFFVLI